MMRDLEPLGQSADSRFLSLGQTLDGKEQLVLLGFKTLGTRSLFTKAEKLIAKLGECLIPRDRDLISGIHHANLPVKNKTSYDERTIAEWFPLCQAPEMTG